MINKEDIFIFSEAFNCGIILKKALETFFKFHPDYKIHIFGTYKDFKELKEFTKNLEFIELSNDEKLKEQYKNGHWGTANIFTKVLKNEVTDKKYIIHFDSDVIFRGECLSDIINGFNEGYDLIGQRRSYAKNRCNRNDLNHLSDVVGTCFFGINLDKITNRDFDTTQRMVAGYYNPLNHAILDFFDPISFDVLNNGGKIKYLNFNDYGSSNEEGSWDNKLGELNLLFDAGLKLFHYAGIGSGASFLENGQGSVPNSYANWAKERYSMYMKIHYNIDIYYPYNQETYNKIKELF